MKKIWIPIFGLGLIFLYFGVDKFIHPLLWISWIPTWMDGVLGISKSNWNNILAMAEIILALLLIIPRTRKMGATFMALYLIPIIIMTFPSNIAIRDIGILSLTIYLVLYE